MILNRSLMFVKLVIILNNSQGFELIGRNRKESQGFEMTRNDSNFLKFLRYHVRCNVF